VFANEIGGGLCTEDEKYVLKIRGKNIEVEEVKE